MRKGFLIYEEMRKYFLIYEEVLFIYDFATAVNLIFFFISVGSFALQLSSADTHTKSNNFGVFW
jgi:hypothetical protein